MSEIMDQHVICDELTNLVLYVDVAVWSSCGGDFVIIPSWYVVLYVNS
jgi:hypothetical protein